MRFLFTLLLSICGFNALCCMNEYRPPLDGKSYGTESPILGSSINKNPAILRSDLNEAHSFYTATGGLSDVTAITTDVETALKSYKMAKKYGPESMVMEEQTSYFLSVNPKTSSLVWSSAQESGSIVQKSRPYLIPGSVIIILIIAFAVMRRRKKGKDGA